MAIINDRGALAQRILHSVFWQWSKTRQKNVWVVHLSEEHLILQLRYLELGLEHHYPDIACFNCIVAGIPLMVHFYSLDVRISVIFIFACSENE